MSNKCYLMLSRNSHWRSSVRKDVRRNFAKFWRKHLCQSLFFNKVAVLGENFCELCEICKDAFYTEYLCTTAFDYWILENLCKHNFFIDEKRTQLNLDTKVKVFHESISCFMNCPWNRTSWNALNGKLHSVSLP